MTRNLPNEQVPLAESKVITLQRYASILELDLITTQGLYEFY